ncbi:MAG: AmmeMemoRadiSam system protein B [Ignavibacteriales bacterium]|nr:AmmeMemoRadiSam system protein B [Ignavibacteriales bacterium]
MSNRQTLLLAFAVIVLSQSVPGQQSTPTKDRQPAVAGQFYPGDVAELRSMLKDLFSHAVPSKNVKNVAALICPHAGYVFSGGVAASAFNQLDVSKRYENIFIIGPSHHVGFEGASVYISGNFVTPLGIVPIVVGAGSPATLRDIALVLRPYFNDRNLFIISSDFSHYPAYDDAKKADRATADAILTRSPDVLIRVMKNNEESGIPNMATSLCGWPCVLTLLYMIQDDPKMSLQLIDYKNSGDSPAGQKDQVVGYCAIVVSRALEQKKESFNLSDKDKKDLLILARQTVEQYVKQKTVATVEPSAFSKTVGTNCGAFVTLRKNGDLRGCIGRFDASEPLYSVVQKMAVASSSEDYRFSPVSPEEVDQLEIEISVLTPMRRIKSVDEFHLGKQGIYIKKGARAGTFLPQVAEETGWTKEEFLGHCAQDKAGLGWNGWKDAELYVYEALVFSEKDLHLR